MNKRSERLWEALSSIEDEKIDLAAPVERRVFHWKRWSALAAVLVLAAGIGSFWWFGMGGMDAPGSGAGGGGHEDGSTVFMSYAGPVFPLTLREADPDLTAARQITLDFSAWASSSADIQVADTYTLDNPSKEDKEVSVLYPFVSSLRDLHEDLPSLWVGDEVLGGSLYAGGYSGGFQNVEGGEEGELLNLSQLDSWEQYRDLLSDGQYQAAALEAWPDLSHIPVFVYEFTDYWGPEPDEEAGIPNPSIRASFSLDYDKTTVLSYGFHGARFDREAGFMIQEFSIPQSFHPGYGNPYYLYVVGDDIQNLTTGGYVTGGTDDDTEALEGCRVKVERYETDLDSALRGAAELMFASSEREGIRENNGLPDFEMYFGLMKEYLVSYGLLSENGPERYETGWLEEMDFANVNRVFYLEAQVAVPAGEKVTLTARMRQEGSFDFYCADTENQGIYGYDLVTKLGSSLDFTEQTAVFEDQGQVEIVRQNFGFDLEKGVREVALDPEAEHYYLEVRGRDNPGKMHQ